MTGEPMTKRRFRRSRHVAVGLLIMQIGAVAASYSYDPAGHLMKVDYGSAGVVLYTYDSAGNLITRQVQPAATAGPTTPKITAVSNAESGSSIIAPNTWTAIYGTNLSPTGDTRTWQTPGDFVNNQLPTQLDGVSVTVNGQSAFVYYISPTQVPSIESQTHGRHQYRIRRFSENDQGRVE